MDTNIISDLLIEKGERYYKIGRVLCKVLFGSIALFLITLCLPTICDGFDPIGRYLTFTTMHPFIFVYVFLIISYLGILIGSFGPMIYFNGLKNLGLGQIAKNTEKE